MPFIVSPYLPFPPVIWWASAIGAEKILLDGEEHFLKATARNRYRIATANGLLQLTIPLQGGRGQRTAMKSVLIDNSVAWQEQHWRSILSAYGRSPFFEYYGPELKYLFLKTTHTHLAGFSRSSILWLCKSLRIPLVFEEEKEFLKMHEDAQYDWRFEHCQNLSRPAPMPRYAQVFEAAHGFLPNLSILDLLMNEGPSSVSYLRQVRTTL